MVTLTDIKQIAYLQLRGYFFTHYTREGKKKIFYYDKPQEEIDKVLADFYGSDISRYLGNYEELKTLIFRT